VPPDLGDPVAPRAIVDRDHPAVVIGREPVRGRPTEVPITNMTNTVIGFEWRSIPGLSAKRYRQVTGRHPVDESAAAAGTDADRFL
jgi:hypothetical protein